MRWFEANPLMKIPLTAEQVGAGLGQLGCALLDHSPFLVKLIVDPAFGCPLLLLADVVKATGERVGGIGQCPQTIVEGGCGFHAAILGGEPLDEMLASFPHGAASVGGRVPVVG